jgi:hypothetical protein
MVSVSPAQPSSTYRPDKFVGVYGDPTGAFLFGYGYKASNTEAIDTATGVDLFTVTGKVLLTIWTMEVTNAFDGANPTDYKLRTKTTNVDLCAASDLHGAAIGCIYQMCGDAGDTLINTASAKFTADTNGKGLANRIIGLAGGSCILQSLRTAGNASDAMIHTLWWLPLESGASITAI